MEWPKEKYPKTTRYAIIEALNKLNFIWVVLLLLTGYIILNTLFGIIYFYYSALGACSNFFDNIYFSFIAGSTIGFGDFSPKNIDGKIIAIFQGLTSTFYFAMMVAFLGIKILFPHHTLHFSDKIIFNGKAFVFRILNSHRGLFVNPEIRINVVAHTFGNVIAPTIPIKKIDDIYWLDNHDFSIHFDDQLSNNLFISNEWSEALKHQGQDKSRFKIRISVTGSYGMQQYTQVVNYGKDDIVRAQRFKPIQYCDEDKRIWRNIRFKKFGNFWSDFNSFEGDI